MTDIEKPLKNRLEIEKKQKELADKRLLKIEIVLGFICTAVLLVFCAVAAFVPMKTWLQVILIVLGCIPLLVALPFLIKIEQTAGYYHCQKCGHKHIPSFKSVFFAMHVGRTRYMRCPKCGQRSWQKKKLN